MIKEEEILRSIQQHRENLIIIRRHLIGALSSIEKQLEMLLKKENEKKDLQN